MTPQPILAPSILSSDFANLERDCRKVLELGADWLHVDVMDGHFVNNITIGPNVVKALRKALPDAFLDCHLMIENPAKWIDEFVKAGASQITFHIEAVADANAAKAICETIRAAGVKSSISVKPKTQIEVLEPLLQQNMLDNVLVMTVEPGFGGQKFMQDMMPKVEWLRSRYPDLCIQVDGGLTPETTPVAVKAGANAVVAGSAVYNAKDIPQAVTAIRSAIQVRFPASA